MPLSPKGAILVNTKLDCADLTRADLRGAHLQGATDLTRLQVNAAYIDGSTVLPDHLVEASAADNPDCR